MFTLRSPLYNWKLKWLWLRHSYRFRWAHKPLCDRFSEDVLTVGNMHLCRSCTFLWTGMAIASATILLLPALRTNIATVAPQLLLVTLLSSAPLFYKQWPRSIRDLLRFSLGASIPLWICLVLMGNLFIGAATAAGGLAAWYLYSNSRKARKASACDGCPELNQPQVCSGCTLKANEIRLYENKATQLFLDSGRTPF